MHSEISASMRNTGRYTTVSSRLNLLRDWRIYADWAQSLIRRARKLYATEPFALELDQTVYALDATVIDLCLSLFPWAHFRSTKAAIKLHTLLDLRGSIPTFLALTEGAVHEVNLLDDIPIEPGAIYVMDRGYLDFTRLARFTQAGAFFVIRAKSNLHSYVSASRPVDRTTGLRCDQSIRHIASTSELHVPVTCHGGCFFARFDRSNALDGLKIRGYRPPPKIILGRGLKPPPCLHTPTIHT